jgi:hypothetical protein
MGLAQFSALGVPIFLQLFPIGFRQLLFVFLTLIHFVVAGTVRHRPSSFCVDGIGSSGFTSSCLTGYSVNGGASFLEARLASFSCAFWRVSFSR